MKTLRLVFSLIVSSLITLSLIGCGSNTSDSDNTHNADNAPDINRDLIVVGFAQTGAESDWRIANTLSMRESFTEARGYQLLFADAQQDPAQQIDAVYDFIAWQVDYIIIAPLLETGWEEVLHAAQDADIPVILVDRMISVNDDSLYTCWVGSDFRKEGNDAVLWMEEQFADQPLNIVHIQGSLGSSAQIGRTEGLVTGIARHPNWQLTAQETGDFTESMGKAIMERLLKQNVAFDVIYCENDNMAFGVMQALDDAHIAYGLGTGITIISFDATHAGLDATLAGSINLNVECNPLHGPRAEEVITQLQAGQTPLKRYYVEEMIFAASTITQADIDAREY
jgi:simple sugar transport system substrate-binding protein